MPADPLTRFGELFQHRQLSGLASWLYDIPFDRLQEALSGAKASQGDGSYSYHVGYVAGSGLNAAAWHVQPAGCAVGIYSSVPPLVYMACMQVASLYDKHTALPLLAGDQLKVQGRKVRLRRKLAFRITTEPEITHMLDVFHAKERTNIPFGLLLCEIALKFIAMHECMHVILGHTRYMEEELGFHSFLEFSNTHKSRTELSQTLELIADRNALRGLYVRLLKGDFDHFHKEALLDGAAVHPDIYITRCLVLAGCILFHLFPGNHASIHKEHLSHPHPYVRARFMCNELMQEVNTDIMDPYEPLSAMTWAGAHLSANFTAYGNWEQASRQDFDAQKKESHSDNRYRMLLAQAGALQPYLSEHYGVRY